MDRSTLQTLTLFFLIPVYFVVLFSMLARLVLLIVRVTGTIFFSHRVTLLGVEHCCVGLNTSQNCSCCKSSSLPLACFMVIVLNYDVILKPSPHPPSQSTTPPAYNAFKGQNDVFPSCILSATMHIFRRHSMHSWCAVVLRWTLVNNAWIMY